MICLKASGATALLLFLTVVTCSVAKAQETETRREFWPEVDVFVPLTPKFRLGIIATVTRVEETKEDTEASIGAHIDFTPRKEITFRAGYRYGFSLTDSDSYKEHRIILEQTYRRTIPLTILLSDRNREELRFVNGNFSGRYRNRLTLEREFSLRKLRLTPYASGEIFYDTRFDTWNRNRLTGGVQVPLKRGFPIIGRLNPGRIAVLDLYLMRQNDSRSDPPRVVGVGATFNLYW
jgi:hypothetical protein